MSKIATIRDKDGDVWTGAVKDTSPGIGDLVAGILCPPLLAASLTSSSETTVVVNGEKHTGRKVG